MNSLVWLVNTIIHYLTIALFIYIIIDLLVKFDAINTYNRLVLSVINFLSRIFEPILKIIRIVIPRVGGIDISAIILVLLLQFAAHLVQEFSYGLY
ncbi:YggT family protein [Candidatus Endolissoclinum faulkneri]|nr:YggT family protein [Candidatus Endolissoclinum faulkneri]